MAAAADGGVSGTALGGGVGVRPGGGQGNRGGGPQANPDAEALQAARNLRNCVVHIDDATGQHSIEPR